MKAALAALLAIVAVTSAEASDDLTGTYRLVSSSRTIIATGETQQFTNERGFITYGKDGRMMVIIVRGTRPKADSVEKLNDQQRADLFRTVTAYGGTYKFDGKTVEHHIDISWNEVWTGTTQIRDVKREAGRVILTTRPAPFSGDGKVSVVTLIWEKLE